MSASSERHRLYHLIARDQRMRNVQEDAGWRPGSRDRPTGPNGYDPILREATLPFVPPDLNLVRFLNLRRLGR